MSELGTKFMSVWLLIEGEWFAEKHVDGPDIGRTILMSIERLEAPAMHQAEGWWLITTRAGRTKTFPNREAAEMYAIHCG